ncbi:MAG: YihA family ribosome biogenesis GTP-binding protein [Thalassobium sp.]|jgi:GTP-binding protein|uniref:Probable GTP-binding protein EngB n=1 Tax=Thalassolituus pacificus TaxID=2975440 RepID=A0A9X2WEU9_9GAMM|nr:ribosome biogenesis GTP-binding protein YihA/YsxC [Thalassolituus pacificus]MCT7359122.1 ribosome biogenesis GTP-binding protein YihA/YsxC [Thalassolituus pacificus]PHS65297.1 MAG: YihA family ribosome biogenesis GTP-binding protein [Thalassobium sp.]
MIEQESLTYTNTHFVKSAAKLSQCPMDILREVAFAGRSNAGKSSALNRLTGHKKLARTSKTPGRTQLINYFQIGELPLALVDLPGYGFAKVPLAVKNEWQRELDNYLQNRDALIGLVLLMDIRHPLKEFDNAMIQWAKRSEMPLHILLTKADKLKRGPAQSALLQVRKAVSSLGNLVSVQTYSSLNGEGTDILQKRLNSWLLPVDDDAAADAQETPPA